MSCAAPAGIDGTYVWLGDSDGAKPNAGANITLAINGSVIELVAASGAERVSWAGSCDVSGQRVTLSFVDLESGAAAKDAPFSWQGDELAKLLAPLVAGQRMLSSPQGEGGVWATLCSAPSSPCYAPPLP